MDMKVIKHQKCEICGRDFSPDRRIGSRQKVCSNLACQQERCYRAQKNWLKKNPNYFKGRYQELKEKIKERSTKIENAESHKDNHQQNIQDEITISKNKLLPIMAKLDKFQDEISSRITSIKLHFSAIADDIQDELTYL